MRSAKIAVSFFLVQLAVISIGTESPGSPLEIGVGSSVPGFEVWSLEGKRLDSMQLRGKVLVLNFWFIACPPCRTEIPRLNQVVAALENRDVVFIAFAADGVEELKEFLASYPFRYEVVADATPIAELFGIEGAPVHLVIDRRGQIVWLERGALSSPETELRDVIENTLRTGSGVEPG